MTDATDGRELTVDAEMAAVKKVAAAQAAFCYGRENDVRPMMEAEDAAAQCFRREKHAERVRYARPYVEALRRVLGERRQRGTMYGATEEAVADLIARFDVDALGVGE